MQNKVEFEIDRRKWLRGEGTNASALLRSADGKLCCLGFVSKACGVTEDDMRDIAEPASLPAEVRANMPSCLFARKCDNSESSVILMRINDGTYLQDEEREIQLNEELKNHGITLKFTN